MSRTNFNWCWISTVRCYVASLSGARYLMLGANFNRCWISTVRCKVYNIHLKRKLNFDPLSPSASDAPEETSSASTPAGSAGVASSSTFFKATSSPPPSLQPSLEIPCILQARHLCAKTFNSEEDHKNHMMKAHYGGACITCQLWDPRRKCKERKSCRTVYEYYRPGKYWTWQLAGGVFGKIDGVDHRCEWWILIWQYLCIGKSSR